MREPSEPLPAAWRQDSRGSPDRGGGSAISRYAFALVSSLVALGVTLLLTRWLEDFPLLIFLTAVLASAARGGTGPGIVSTLACGFSLLVATHELADRFAIPRVNLGAEVVRLAIFLCVSAAISLLAGAGRRAGAERDALLLRAQDARRQAEAANLAKDQFLATVSHELRNPLAAILAWANLLRGPGRSEQNVERALEVIERNTRLQALLIDDLLDVSRIVAGKLRLEVRPTTLGPPLEAAVDAIRPAAEAKRIALRIELDDEAGVVNGDPARLQQVFWNLLSNAVKFTPEGGEVRVRLTRSLSHALLEVRDTGVGIAADSIPHLFERFWQEQTDSGPRSRGLGLGLAIVRNLVDLHGGAITVHSAGLGSGASFRITLPLIEPRFESPATYAREA